MPPPGHGKGGVAVAVDQQPRINEGAIGKTHGLPVSWVALQLGKFESIRTLKMQILYQNSRSVKISCSRNLPPGLPLGGERQDELAEDGVDCHQGAVHGGDVEGRRAVRADPVGGQEGKPG